MGGREPPGAGRGKEGFSPAGFRGSVVLPLSGFRFPASRIPERRGIKSVAFSPRVTLLRYGGPSHVCVCAREFQKPPPEELGMSPSTGNSPIPSLMYVLGPVTEACPGGDSSQGQSIPRRSLTAEP